MRIEQGAERHLERWAQLRMALWPHHPLDRHRRDIGRILQGGGRDAIGFVALTGTGRMVGFAEATLRRDHVNGCSFSPVVFLEGLYVRPDARRRGVARRLCAAVEGWGRTAGCSEFTSDSLLANEAGHAVHRMLGFEETERVVFFSKQIRPGVDRDPSNAADPGSSS